MRLHVGIFGRRNVGKSSLLNAMVRQHVSLVSDVAGTTTDPVEKPMELLPLGPVLFIDTAGIDDEGALGDLRVKRTTEVFDRTDLGLIVAAGEWGPFEEAWCARCRRAMFRCVVAFNKSDVAPAAPAQLAALRERGLCVVETSAVTGAGLLDLRQALLDQAPADYLDSRAIVGRSGRPGRDGRAGGSHRQGSSQGPPDPAAGAGAARSAGPRRVRPGGERARAARRPRPVCAPRPGWSSPTRRPS